MFHHFNVIIRNNNVIISLMNKNLRIHNISITIDNNYVGTMSFVHSISLQLDKTVPNQVMIQADIVSNSHLYRVHEIYTLRQVAKNQSFKRETTYKKGDILVGCDNMNGLPYGYMGHAALVVDEETIIESTPLNPIVRRIPIHHFTNDHPIHAHYRPKNPDMGEKAGNYAIHYLKQFEENKKQGIDKPIFQFSLNTPLEDEWTYIYCSKLVWLSYHYGANYDFINDHLWFAPEDLYSNLNDNPDFELIYKHPNFVFYIDV